MRNDERRVGREELMREAVPGRKAGIVHLRMVREERSLYGMGRLQSPGHSVEIVRPLLEASDREMLVVLSLTVKMEPLALEIVAVGGIRGCCMEVGNIFKHSLLNNAAGVMCFHNHPSGDPGPSGHDYRFTRQVKKAGRLLGIELVDHIIIGREGFYSFKEHGEIDAGVDVS